MRPRGPIALVACGLLAATTAVVPGAATDVAAADPEPPAPPLVLRDQAFVIPGSDALDELTITVAGDALGPAPCTTDSDTIRVVAYRPVATRQAADDALVDPGEGRSELEFDLCELERQPNGAVQLTVPTDVDGDGIEPEPPPAPPDEPGGDAAAPPTTTDPSATTDPGAPSKPATPEPAEPDPVEGLDLPDAGVIPIGVEVRRAGEVDGSLLTFIDRQPTPDDETDPPERMHVAVAFLVDGGPTLQPGGERILNDLDRAAVNDALELVEQTGDAPIALGVRPELVEGMAASPADREAFTELASVLGQDRVSLMSLPYVAIDPSAAAAAGAQDLFTDQLRRGEDVFRQLIPAARTQRSLWVFDQPVNAEGAELLRGAGVQRAALTPPHAFSLAPNDRQFEIDYGGGTLPATPIDDRVAASLADPGADPVLTAHHLAARVLLTRQEAADADEGWWTPMVEHNMILSTPSGRIGNVEATATFIRLLDAAPELALVAAPSLTSSSILDQAGLPYRVVPPPADVVPLATVSNEVGAARTTIDAIASMLPANDPRPARWRQQLAVAASAALDASARRSHLDAVRGATRTIRDAIVPLQPSSFTLGGRHSTLRLTLTNTGPDDLTVRVIISSTKLEIAPDDDDRLVEVPAGQSVEHKVPVEARSNGRFPVDIRIVTPADDRVPITDPVQFSARVNALTGLGQFATGGFLLVLLSWWVQHLRKRRRSTADAPAT